MNDSGSGIIDPGSVLEAQQQIILEIARRISREPNIDPLIFFPQVLKSLNKRLKLEQMGIYLLDDHKQHLHLIEQFGLPAQSGRQIVRLNDSNPLAACLRAGQPQYGHMPGLGQVMAAPIVGVELSVGTVAIIRSQGTVSENWPEWESFLATLGYLLGIALEHTGLINELLRQIEAVNYMQQQELERASLLEDQNRNLQQLIITDPLTGLVNRRHLDTVLDHEIARSQRTGTNFCLCLIDIDHFKSINDNLGHLAGDQALVLIAKWLTEGLRRVDVVSRYGGEEFVIILSDCLLNAGIKVAEQLRAKVEQASQTAPFALYGGFTISAGIIQYQAGMDLHQLFDSADAAMYRAKRAGRNRVEAVAPSPPDLEFPTAP
ncbi:MAG: GGDEF domain-containing protein [Desulfarculales bacterium]|jgi:diguanylate cyclase (GGDEF)-like protein|nr:GGDEF domain-containing protein [Desulfarculales bacterium]